MAFASLSITKLPVARNRQPRQEAANNAPVEQQALEWTEFLALTDLTNPINQGCLKETKHFLKKKTWRQPGFFKE